MVFLGCVVGVYDTWEEASRQVLKFPNTKYMSYKNKRDAEIAYVKFLQSDVKNVQYGASLSWTSPYMSAASPLWTPQSEGSSYYNGDLNGS